MCTKQTLGHILAFLIQSCLPGRSLTQTTRPNELTWMPSNDLPEGFYIGSCTTETKPQGRTKKTSCMNVHKANLGSQLSIFDTGSFAWACPRPNELTRMPSNDLPERVDTDTLK